MKSKKDKLQLEFQPLRRHTELIDTVRVQMQISEAMDVCIRQRLIQFFAMNMSGKIDVPRISLGLLSSISKSDFLNEKSYIQWKNRQANILEELLCFSASSMTSERLTVKSSIAKIKNSKEWDFIMSRTERDEVLSAITQIASKWSSLPGRFGIQCETCYWTAGYHLNIRIYEKLLFGVFDVLEEGELIAEADEILMLIKMSWSTLGITQRMHSALYGWVFFQQFIGTDETMLLENAIAEVQKVLSAEENDEKEELYLNSLVCSRLCNGIEVKLSLVQAIFFSMSIWCDSKLKDYHLHFSKKLACFRMVMTLASAVGLFTSNECSDIKSIKLDALNGIADRKLETYVERSIEAAYKRVIDIVDLESKTKRLHPLALLANELRLIVEREFTIFCPVIRNWCCEAGMISAMLLHRLYGRRLKPFLEGVSCLSEDVRSVLSAADMLDYDLTRLYTFVSQTSQLHKPPDHGLDHYQIEEVSRPIILDWVIAQHAHILEWTKRASDLEDWECLSLQQKHAASIIEVFRILEETVDRFFGLDLPMDITHLQALLSVIFHSLNSYVRKVVNQLVEKNHLFPSAPSLTRYQETIIPIIKKKLVECIVLEDKVSDKLTELTITKLCVKLNTLQYIHKQVGELEDGIRKSWALVRSSVSRRCSKEGPPETLESAPLTSTESVDEHFVATFDIIRDSTIDAINKICDFFGAKVVFWDMRDSFLFHLYRGKVAGARLDRILPHIDTVLDHICGLIDEILRDRVVLSVCRALLEGFVWVLLDGGPSRAFSDSDIILIKDDLNMLKDFFVSEGEGLPLSVVNREAKFAEEILILFSLETQSLIQMLMSASEQISTGLDSCKRGRVRLDDAQTLIRVLCHKKDPEASRFLKRKYQLPTSSEYDDALPNESTASSPLISDLLNRSASFRWSEKGQSSFISIKKKLQQTTSEIRHHAAAW